MLPFRKLGVRDYKPALSSLCESVPGKKQLLQHLSQSSALHLSSYLKHISRIIIISFFCGAKVIAPCCIWCEDLQTGHHKSWNGNHTRRIAAVPWGLRAVLMGWNSKKKRWFLGGMKTETVVKRDLLWSASVCLRIEKGPFIVRRAQKSHSCHYCSPRSTTPGLSVWARNMFVWFQFPWENILPEMPFSKCLI